MPCFINISLTLQTEILPTVTSDFLKQMIVLKSFNSVLYFKGMYTETSMTQTPMAHLPQLSELVLESPKSFPIPADINIFGILEICYFILKMLCVLIRIPSILMSTHNILLF